MGFSLEALIALPCCLTVLAYSTGLAGPVAAGLKQTADLTASAAITAGATAHTCRHFTLERAGGVLPVVTTNPQKILEALSLAHDLLERFGGSKEKLTDFDHGA